MSAGMPGAIAASAACACALCGAAPASASASASAPHHDRRRRALVLGWAAAALLARTARAADPPALMDPAQIGAARQPAAGPLATMPASPAGPAGSDAGRTGKLRPEARYMAARVVDTLDTLTRSAAHLVESILRWQAELAAANTKRTDLVADMAAKMDEYRQGLFCSGCGKTKSEILAKGETFPHSGQHIVQPTPEQILAKERQLQAPIDTLEREIRELRAKIDKAMPERDELFAQISAGVALWRTAFTFEHTLINAREEQGMARYKAAFEKAGGQVKLLQGDLNKTRDREKERRASLLDEIDMWQMLQRKMSSQREADQAAYRQQLQGASQQVRKEQAQLQEYVGRGKLHLMFALVVTVTYANTGAPFNDLGGLYRMGDASVARHDEVLASVKGFIAEFRAGP